MSQEIKGWKKDPFDEKAVYHKRRVARLPDVVDLSPFIPAIGYQDGVSACTGFGFGGHCATTAAQLGIIVAGKKIHYSPNWIYNGARKKEGTLNSDEGAYPDDCANWIVENGLVTWADWPFIEVFDKTDPVDKLIYTKLYPNRKKVRVDNGADGIMAALADGHTVAIGTPWFANWRDYSEGVLPKVNSSSVLAGGHETYLYGFNRIRGTVLGPNSWGEWGILIAALGTRGGYEMDAEAFEVMKNNFGGYDAHIITFAPPTDPEVVLVSIAIQPASLNLVKGYTRQLSVLGHYSNGSAAIITPSVKWSSDNTDFVTVGDTGVVMGVGVGSANVTADYNGYKSTMRVSVTTTDTHCSCSKAVVKTLNAAVRITRQHGKFKYE